jgi:SnoaL-like protein
MKSRNGSRVLTVGALCLLLSVSAGAQSPSPQEEAEHEALRQMKSIYEQAIREGRLELLAGAIHPEFHGVMVTGRVVNSGDDLRKYWQDIRALIGDGGSYTTTVNADRSVIMNDIALAQGTTDDVVVTSGKQEFRFNTMWTAVLQKVDGRWKLRRVQGTLDPVDNVFVREFTRRAIMWTAGISAVAGIIAGAIGAVVISRRRRVGSK